MEVALPFRLALETNALYQRFHYSSAGDDLTYGNKFTAKTTGNAWSFPVMLKLRLHHLPYVAAGPVVRHLGGIQQVRNETIASFPLGRAFTMQQRHISNPADLAKRWYPGVAVAGGYNLGFSRLRVSPELRYTRWTANIATDNVVPLRFPANQFELLLGFAFGTRRR